MTADDLRDPAMLRAVLADPRRRDEALAVINTAVLDGSYVFRENVPLKPYVESKVKKDVYTLREVSRTLDDIYILNFYLS